MYRAHNAYGMCTAEALKTFTGYYLYVSVNYLVVMQVFETLQYLFGVETDGWFIVF